VRGDETKKIKIEGDKLIFEGLPHKNIFFMDVLNFCRLKPPSRVQCEREVFLS
jgi:hypothetical protein